MFRIQNQGSRSLIWQFHHLCHLIIDKELSFEWMKHTGLKGKTEGLNTAVQDQALNTRYYHKHIIKQGTTDLCRMYQSKPETVEHIISGC